MTISWLRLKLPAILAGILCLPALLSAVEPASTQNFDTWYGAPITVYGCYTNTDNWKVNRARIQPGAGGLNPIPYAYSPTNAAHLSPYVLLTTNDKPYVQSCELKNGAGVLSFMAQHVKVRPVTNEVRYSIDAGATWTTQAWFQTVQTNWTLYTFALDTYTNTIVQIRKIDDGNAAGQIASFDDISILLPLSRVNITNVTTTPSQPVTESPFYFNATIQPLALASNLRPRVYWSTNNGEAFTSTAMTNVTGDSYASIPIPAINQAGRYVCYYIEVIFDGSTTNDIYSYMPTNAPAITNSFMIQQRPFLSSQTNMQITGDLQTNLFLCADYLWAGVKKKGSYSSPILAFSSGSATWGDSNQSDFDLPINAYAEPSSTFQIIGTLTNHLLFNINDSNLAYSAQTCQYINFDDWVAASSSNGVYTDAEGWNIVTGRTTQSSESSKAFRSSGRTLVLQAGSNACLRSPFMTNGVGSLKFRYRNWLNDGSTSTSFRVEKSTDGTNNWTTVYTINDILSSDYLHFAAGIAEATSRYIRVVNTSSNVNLCIDEIWITDPGDMVLLSNAQRSQTYTNSGEPLYVQIDFTPSGSPSNIRGTVFWLAPDSVNEACSAMVITGSTMYATIPATMTGILRYYYLCEYNGIDAGPVRFPESGYLEYTNSATVIPYRYEPFSWPAAKTTFRTWTNNEWVAHLSKVQGRSTLAGIAGPLTTPYACWMTNLLGGTNFPHVRSPLLTNGVGVVAFSATNRLSGVQEVQIQYSFDNVNWFTNLTVGCTNPSASGWVSFSAFLNIFSNCYVRLQKVSDTGQSAEYLGMDEITVSPPSADITIENIHFFPGYPTTGTEIEVYCDIYSVNQGSFKAFDFRPTLCYRFSNSPLVTTNPMTQVASNSYRCSIPSYTEAWRVEYFIRCDFAGYYYTNEAISGRIGTRFSPSAPIGSEEPDDPYFFILRRWKSSHDSIIVSVSTGTVEDIQLVDDYVWQGFMAPPREATNLSLSFSGLREFLGSSYSSATNIWGDDEQALFDTPLTGIATQDGAQISVALDTSSLSRVMFRLNTSNNTYEIRRCVYQDFNDFSANPNYFNYSMDLGNVNILTNNFDSWATNVIYVTQPDVDMEWFGFGWSWTMTNFNWGYLFATGGVGWWINDAWVYYEMGKIPFYNLTRLATNYDNYAALLGTDPDGTNGCVFPQYETLTRGLKTFSFDARASCPTSLAPLVFNNNFLTNYTVEVKWYVPDSSPGSSRFMLMAPYYSPTNYFAHEVIRTNNGSYTTPERIRILGTRNRADRPRTVLRNDGTYDVDFTNTIFTSIFRISGDQTGTYFNVYIEGVNLASGSLAVNLSFYDTWTTNSILFTNSTFAIASSEADLMVDSVRVRHSDMNDFVILSMGYSNFTYGGWAYTNASIGRPTSGYAFTTNHTNSYIVSPDLGHYSGGFTTINFVVRNAATANNGALVVEGSVNRTSWTLMAAFTNINQTETNIWITNSVPAYRWFRLRTATNGFGITNNLRFDYVRTEAANYIYNQDFSGTVPPEFTDPTGYWTGTIAGEGLTGDYYQGTNWLTNTQKLSRIDAIVNFNWGNNNPHPLLAADYFTVRWTGMVQPEYSEVYWFSTYSDDGCRLWVNNQLLIDQWIPQGSTWWSNSIALVGGSNYEIKLEYLEITGGAVCSLYWQSARQNKMLIPSSRLFATIPAVTNWGVYCPGYVGPTVDFVVESFDPPDPYIPDVPNETDWTNAAGGNLSTSNGLDYQNFSLDFNVWNKLFVRVRKVSTNADLFVDNLTMSSWRAETFTQDNWVVHDGWIASNPVPANINNSLELWRSRTDPSLDQYIEISLGTNGSGLVTFDYNVNSTNVALALEYGLKDTNLVITNVVVPFAAGSWLPYELYINSPSATYIRVHHFTDVSSNIAAKACIDNLEVSDYKAMDAKVWEAFNALITSTNDSMEFEPGYEPGNTVKTAYLNNNRTNNVFPGKDFATPVPYIQSERLVEGVGEIGFWCRNWETNGAASKIRIYSCNDPDAPFPSQWKYLHEYNITSPEYVYYKYTDYIVTNFYVRIATMTNSPAARACIDNIIIAEPLAASIKAINITPIPGQPLYNNAPRFQLELGRFRMHPSNISARLYYQCGTNDWGNQASSWPTTTQFLVFNQTNWSNKNGMLLETSSALPTNILPALSLIDTVVQYYAYVTFQGFFSHLSSPYESHGFFYSFTNPAHYYPVDLNKSMGTYTNPYYYVYSCPPGAVWINELNYKNGLLFDVTNEYVELCGPAGSIIGNWRIQLLDTTTNVYEEDQIAPSTFSLPDDTGNGFGFFVYGDVAVNGDMSFPPPSTATNIAANGGIRLIRSMNAYEYQLAYGTDMAAQEMTNGGFQYIGFKPSGLYTPMHLINTGSNYNDFAWSYGSVEEEPFYTAGALNLSQTLEWPPPLIELIGETYSTNTMKLIFTSSSQIDMYPVPWYSTNLVSNTWIQVTGSSYSWAPLSNTYTQNFNTLTNSRVYFFKIVPTTWR